MLMAFVLLLSCGQFYGHVDWSSFERVENIDDRDSLSLIKGLPMHQYWDVQRGSFRTGIIGEKLNTTLPQYVSSLSTKVGKGGTTSTIESLVVDQVAIYMHGISALRRLGNISREIQDAVSIDAIVRTSNVTTGLSVNTTPEPSVDDVKALQHAALVHLTALSTTAAEVEDDFMLVKQLINDRNATAVADQLLAHNRLLDLLNDYFRRGLSTLVDKYDQLDRDHTMSEDRLRVVRKQLSNEEHSSANEASLREVERVMETLRFRAEEELKMVKQQQEFEDSQLMSTKSEVLQAEVEQVIGAFFAELVSCAQQCVADPGATLSAVMYGLLVVVVMLTVLELVHTVSDAVRRLSGASHLPQVRLLANRPTAGSEAGVQLHWPATVTNNLQQVYRSIQTAVDNSLPLPCVLVAGSTGSGKSTALKNIMDGLSSAERGQSRPVFVVEVCGADLRALGDGEAARFLNDLVCRRRAGPMLLVIDDADCIIRRRHRSSEGDKRSSGCLFALLAGLRENSARVGLLLATRLSVDDVDEAILDRYFTSSQAQCLVLLSTYSPCYSHRLLADWIQPCS